MVKGGKGLKQAMAGRLAMLKRKLPIVVANEVLNFSRESFRVQGWIDTGLEKWQEVRRREADDSGGFKYKGHWARGYDAERGKVKWGDYTKADRTRAILVGRGDLRRSLRIIKRGWNGVVVGSELVYAGVHNWGGKAGRGRGFKMPKRQFIGVSAKMFKGVEGAISRVVKEVF